MERHILSQAAEFACLRRIFTFSRNVAEFYVFVECSGIRYWLVIRGQIWHIFIGFRGP